MVFKMFQEGFYTKKIVGINFWRAARNKHLNCDSSSHAPCFFKTTIPIFKNKTIESRILFVHFLVVEYSSNCRRCKHINYSNTYFLNRYVSKHFSRWFWEWRPFHEVYQNPVKQAFLNFLDCTEKTTDFILV